MSNAELCLKSVHELLSEMFFVPSYQRGYRWTPRQVTQLLDDLWEFKQRAIGTDKAFFYCLQPLVVKLRADASWELVDGQQRLTTIRLILHALKRRMEDERKTSFSLVFETRGKTSGAFLENIDPSRRNENIDYYHICNAYGAIEKWFDHPDAPPRGKIFDCLLDDDRSGHNVKVIWYKLDQRESAVDAFTRLNVGKIPLTNAELIRGLFLRSSNYPGVAGSLRQLGLAQEWDAIEKSLQRDEIWYFLHHGKNSPVNRIDHVFDLIAREAPPAPAGPGVTPTTDDPYYTFFFYQRKFDEKGADAGDLWQEVKNYFMTLEEWFNDRSLYHLIGYLIHENAGDQKREILELRATGGSKAKSDFERILKARIYRKLIGQDLAVRSDRAVLEKAIRTAVEQLEYTTAGDGKRIRSFLLLFNLATLLQNSASNQRFPFDKFKTEAWDIEHVRSVASAKPEHENERKEWLKNVADFLDEVGTGDDAAGAADEADGLASTALNERTNALWQSGKINDAAFDVLYDDLLRHFGEKENTDVDNDIGNLVLLDAGTNRSYKNAVFPIKRRRIVDLDKQGTFVPLCTRNVFLKCYSKCIKNMMFWDALDNREYTKAIVTTLTSFFWSEQGGLP